MGGQGDSHVDCRGSSASASGGTLLGESGGVSMRPFGTVGRSDRHGLVIVSESQNRMGGRGKVTYDRIVDCGQGWHIDSCDAWRASRLGNNGESSARSHGDIDDSRNSACGRGFHG